MSDTYQAVYDATCRRIGSCSTHEAVKDAVAFAFGNASHAVMSVQQDFAIAAGEMQRPSVLYRPKLMQDGDQWCALYGNDIATGVVGYGETPAKAMSDFDAAWTRGRTAAAAKDAAA